MQTTAGVAGGRPKACALYQCGLGRLQLGDVRGAYEDFKEAARIEPRDLEIWRRYEETYRDVEAEMEAELAQCPTAATSISGGRGLSLDERASSAGGEHRQLPPKHFTLKDTQHQYNEEVVSPVGASGVAAEVQARLLRPVQRQRRHSMGEAAVGRAHVDSNASFGGAAGREQLEITFIANRVYLVIFCSWITTWGFVIYHYRYQRRARTRVETTEMFCGSGAFGLFLWLIWRRRKSKTPIVISLSDATKILSGLVILACTLYHYYTL